MAAMGDRQQPPSDADAQSFALSFEKTLASGNIAEINAAIDMDALLRCAMSGIDYPQDLRESIVAGTKALSTRPTSIAAGLASTARRGRFRLLHVHRQGDQQRALFRLNEVDGIDYLDLILVRSADGKVRIGDLYEYVKCEQTSEGFRRQCLRLACQKPEMLAKLSSADREFVDHAEMIEKMRQLAASGQFRQMLDTYQQLPETLKSQPDIICLRLIAAGRGEGNFDDVLRAYRAARPDNPGLELFLLEYYGSHQQLDNYAASLERLDKAVGGDPLLDAYRAAWNLDKGNLAAAKKCLQNAAAVEPDARMVRNISQVLAQVERNPAFRATRPTGARPPDSSPGEAAGDAEAQTFAAGFEKAVMAKDAAAIRAGVNAAALSGRAAAKLAVPESLRAYVQVMLVAGARASIADSFVGPSEIDRGASFRLLHVHREGNEQRALFRLVASNDDLNYLDCILVRHADGSVRIDDVYSFQVGEMLSESLHRELSAKFAPKGDATQTAAAEANSTFATLSEALKEMDNRSKSGKYRAALDVYEALPDALQADKTALAARIKAARGLKGKPYDDAILAYRKQFHDERNIDLFLIDGYLRTRCPIEPWRASTGWTRLWAAIRTWTRCELKPTCSKATLPKRGVAAVSRLPPSPTCRRRTCVFWRFP